MSEAFCSSSAKVMGKHYYCNVPLPHVFCFLPLQEFGSVYPKLDEPPLSGHAGISPTTQLGTILYKIIRRSRGRQSALA